MRIHLPKTKLRVKLYLIGRKYWRKFYPKFIEKLTLGEVPCDQIPKVIPERIIEYPFVFQNLPRKKARILDVGCYGSYLITELAALGHEVYGIDLRNYPVHYPNVKFVQGNILSTAFPSNFFDMITAVSTVEHIGIKEAYGDMEDPQGDIRAMSEMTRILKHIGKMLITVPYGKCCLKKTFRVYDNSSLSKLIFGLKIDVAEYFARKNGDWVSFSKAEADKIKTEKVVNAVVLLKLSKVRGTSS